MKISQTQFLKKLIPSIDKYSWFLGAGTSANAGLPTANDIIWDLKKRYYCLEEKQDIKNQDIQILAIKNKIQEYFDSKNFPAKYDDNEYSFYFDLMFKEDYEAQRKYLAEVLSSDKIALSIGHRALAALMSNGTTKVVYTTNFDKVIENAYAHVSGKSLGSFHLQGADACKLALKNDEFPLYAKIHGDFQYQKISNLAQDLLKADEEIRKCFVASAARFGTVVAGYSGRDKCVLDLFEEALNGTNAFSHGLYWTTLKNRALHSKAEELISLANEKKIPAYIVEIDSFDSLMAQLWRNLPNRDTELDRKVQRSAEREVVIAMPKQTSRGPMLRFNAVPLADLPSKCFKVVSEKSIDWEQLKEIQKASQDRLIIWVDEDVCVWGDVKEIEKYFPKDSKISLLDISSKVADLKNHKALHSALEKLVCASIAKDKGLISKKNFILISKNLFQSTNFPKLKKSMGQLGGILSQVSLVNDKGENELVTPMWSLALNVRIKQLNDVYFLIFSPDIWISPPRAKKHCREFLDSKRRQLKNDNMDNLISAWIETIFPSLSQNNEVLITPCLPTGDESRPFKTTTQTAYSKRA